MNCYVDTKGSPDWPDIRIIGDRISEIVLLSHSNRGSCGVCLKMKVYKVETSWT